MCGIAGIFSLTGGIAPGDVEAVARMTAAQRHRGPDDLGTFDDQHVALSHRRLSIIDLSAAGKQPLCNEDASIRVVCNGEIYNYRELTRELKALGHEFRSNSDSEVLVHGYEEWGLNAMLRRLRGMFAFALYDSRRAVCYAVRDRLGIKPLYWTLTPDRRCAFASEVQALTAGGLTSDAAIVNPAALTGFLLFGSVPHPLTWREGVRCLEPGSYVEMSAAGARTETYWRAESFLAGESGADAKAVLETAVNQHLISDAPLGIFLSSGVDSTGLLAMARGAGIRARTITVVFDEAAFNEDTTNIARHYDAEHCEIRVTAQDFLNELPHVLDAMDQPATDGLNTFFVSRAAHRAGLKAVLSGLGGDEVFLGYRHYRWLARHRKALQRFAQLPAGVRRGLSGFAENLGDWTGHSSWKRLRGLGNPTRASLYLAMRGFFAPDVVGRLTGYREDDVLRQAGNFEGGVDARVEDFPDSQAFRFTEFKRYLHDQLLRDADVFGMAWALEIRVPFLDHEVVEQALTMPLASHMRPGVNKPVLVDAIGDENVLAAARRPKSGFVFPLDKWMRRHSAELRERAMQANLDRGEMARLWTSFEQGHMNATRAWALVVLGTLQNRPETAKLNG